MMLGSLFLRKSLNGIQDARENIARIKWELREWGIDIEDLPDDIYNYSIRSGS
jgi:hypothetical protein